MRYVHTCSECQLVTAVTAKEVRQPQRCHGCDAPFTVPPRARAKLLAQARRSDADPWTDPHGEPHSGSGNGKQVAAVLGIGLLVTVCGIGGAAYLLSVAKNDEVAQAPHPAPDLPPRPIPAGDPVPTKPAVARWVPDPSGDLTTPAKPPGIVPKDEPVFVPPRVPVFPKIEPRPEPEPVPEPKKSEPKEPVIRPAAAPAKITATKAADKAEIKLPGAADAACYGGGGRYVLFRVPKVKQVAVLDMSEGKITKYLPIPEEGALIAAGNEHLFVIAPTANVIQRWNLTTFEKEVTVPNPLGTGPKQALMGHATDGPLFLAGPGKDGVGFLDARTLKPVELPGRGGWGRLGWWDSYPPAVRVSADGRVFAHWTPGLSPSGLRSLVIGDDGAKDYDQHTSVGAILPGPDGTLFTGTGLYTPDLKAVGTGKGVAGTAIPAAHGRMYVTILGPDRFDAAKRDTKVTLRTLGDDRPLVELGTPEGLDLPTDPWARGGGLWVHDRVFLVPDAKAMAVLNGTADKVVIHKIDLEDLLDKAGIDYLFVASRPPGAVPGTKYAYKPEVRSKKGGVTVKLDAGPEGMTVAADGTVTWQVPGDYAGGQNVILTIADKSGQETFHSFTLAKGRPAPAGGVAVKPPEPQPKLDPKPEPDPKPNPRPAPVAASATSLVRPAANPAKITATKAADKAEIKLPGAADAACYGGGGRYVLLRIPKMKQIAVLDVCEGKVTKYLPLAEEAAAFAAGNEHLFVLNPNANAIQRWSLTTFEKEVTVPNPLAGAKQLLMGHATDGPLFVVGPNQWLDPKTLKEVKPAAGVSAAGAMRGHPQYPPTVRVSADGRVFAWWTQGLSPSGLSSMVVAGDSFKTYNQHTTVGAILPGPDGTLFTGGGIYTPELKDVGKTGHYQYWFHAPVPAAHGKLYLTIPANDLPGQRAGGPKVLLKVLGEEKPIADVTGLAGLDVATDHNQTIAHGVQLYDRVFLVPDAKVMAVLNGTGDKVILHKLDLEELLDKAGFPYLLITSRPPAAVRGAVFSYKPEVKSKAGGVKVKLDAGPEGMTVAADGTVTWKVPADFAEPSASVILTISDQGGQEAFHSFALPVGDPPTKVRD